VRHQFRSMGCAILVGGASRAELAAIERLFAERERTFSRFRADSELNRVNRSAGMPTTVSEAFADMLRLALDVAGASRGLVVPTLGAALEAAGYDIDFSLLRDDPRPAAAVEPAHGHVRLEGDTVHVPPGVRLDLNGVVKGQTVDDALALIDGDGFVSAGGDLATRGTTVVALPAGGAVSLVRGALATSGIDRRRWRRGGQLQHHLIDPRTSRPASSPWEQVTVCGATCVAADVAAKAAFFLGDAGPIWLDTRGLPGRFAAGDRVFTNLSWQRSLEQAASCT